MHFGSCLGGRRLEGLKDHAASGELFWGESQQNVNELGPHVSGIRWRFLKAHSLFRLHMPSPPLPLLARIVLRGAIVRP